MPSNCIVPNCVGSKSRKRLSLFTAPDEVFCQKWADAIGIPSVNRTHRICERHFEEEWIIKDYIKHDNDGNIIIKVPLKRSRLKPGAIPSIFDQGPPECSLSEHIDHSYAVRTALRNSALRTTIEPKNSVTNVDNQMDILKPQLDVSETKLHPEEKKVLPKLQKMLSKNPSKEPKIMPRILFKEPRTFPKILPKEPKVLPKILPKEQEQGLLFQIVPQEFIVIDENINSSENCNSHLLDTSIESPEILRTKDLVSNESKKKFLTPNMTNITSITSPPPDSDSSLDAENLQNDYILPECVETSKEVFLKKKTNECNSMNICFDPVSFNFDCQVQESNSKTNFQIKLPKQWNICKTVSGDKEILVFTYIRVINDHGIQKHILEKSLILNSFKEITYEVFSTPADISETKLPKLLDNVDMLPEILKKFENFRTCKGIPFEKLESVSAIALLQISTGQIWRHKDCKIILLKNDRCLSCKRMYRYMYQSTYKNKKKKTLKCSPKNQKHKSEMKTPS